MGLKSCIARMSSPPPFPNDRLSKTKNRISTIALVLLVLLLAAAAVFFAVYDSRHRFTSVTVAQDGVKIDHILVAFSSGYDGCLLSASIKNNGPGPFAVLTQKPVAGYAITELVSTNNATGEPITDYSNYLVEVMLSTFNADRSCTGYGFINVIVMFILGPVTPESLSQGPNTTWISFGMDTYVAIYVQTTRTTYSNGTTATTFTGSTKYSAPLVTGQEKAFCSISFSSQIQVIQYESKFGLYKRILVDIGSAFTVCSLIAAVFVYVAIRILHQEPAAWINYEMREAVLYTVDAQSKYLRAPTNTSSSQSLTSSLNSSLNSSLPCV